MCCVLQRGHIGNGYELVSTLCKYVLFVQNWARVRRGSVSSELIMNSGGVHSILILSLVARCIETIYIYIYIYMCVYMAHFFYVCCSDYVRVCRNGCCIAGLLKIVFNLGVVMDVCVGNVMDVVFSD